MKKILSKKLSFTLLEMLVVIGIIGILIGIGTVSYSTVQRKARDAKRKQDLKSIQNCLEQYYSVNQRYPFLSQNDNDGAPNDGWIFLPNEIPCGSTNMRAPKDPLNRGFHIYVLYTEASGSLYRICTRLETENQDSPYCLGELQ
jgi:prepilin-type N-terminal cleavage/methylation domain-containing protein